MIKISIADLRIAGVTDTQIVDALQEAQAKAREQNRIRQRNQRARNANHRDSQKPEQNQHSRHANNGDMRDTPSLSFLLTSSLSTSLEKEERLEIVAPAEKQKKSRKTGLPIDWQPKGEQRDITEADEFRDHAKAKGYQYIDWDAAYRNFQKSKYNARNTGGQNGRRHGSVLDAFDRLGQKLKAAGATDNYIPGSSGPRPLELDTQMRANGLKLVPKG